MVALLLTSVVIGCYLVPMRVVVLGGSGRAGRRAVRAVVESGRAEEVVVAGLDGGRARRVAGEHGERAQGVGVDLTDATALSGVLDGADLVLNAVSPFFRHGAVVLRQALSSGCDYADICDDWEPALEMLDLDDEARRAGRTAVIGLGLAPGTDSMLSVRAMGELDVVTDLVTGWSLGGLSGGARAGEGTQGGSAPPSEGSEGRQGVDRTLVHLMHCLSGTIRQRRDGEMVDRRPLEAVELSYPGVGPVTGYTVGSPEAVTLHRRRPEVQSNVNLMVAPASVVKSLRQLRDAVDGGTLSLEDAASLLAEPEVDDAGPSRSGTGDQGAATPAPPTLFAVAHGTCEGDRLTVAASLSGPMPGGHAAAGSVLGLAPGWLGAGLLGGPGVRPFEETLAPKDYFDALAPLFGSSTPTADLVNVEIVGDGG